MQNVGTWNSDLALLFFFMLISPIALYFLGACFEKFRVQVVKEVVYRDSPPKTVYKKSPPKMVYKTSPPKVVYKDRLVTADPKIIYKDPPKKKKAKKESPLTSNKIQQDGIDSLVALGTKKMQARKTIQSLCATKCYNSLDSLIRDAFPHKM